MSRIKKLIELDYEELCEDELNSPELLPFRCPKCSNLLSEIEFDEDELSEAQYQEYLAGIRFLQCPNNQCNFESYCDISELLGDLILLENIGKPIKEVYDLKPIDNYNQYKYSEMPEYFEEYAKRALRKECYIEAISLIHNLLENFLKNNFERKIEKYSKDLFKQKLKKIEENDFSQYCNIFRTLKYRPKRKKEKYLTDWNFLSVCFDLYSLETFRKIKELNQLRINIIHKLMNLNQADDDIIEIYNSKKDDAQKVFNLYFEIKEEIRNYNYEP